MTFNTKYTLEKNGSGDASRFIVNLNDDEYFKYVHLNARFNSIMTEHGNLLRTITHPYYKDDNIETVKQSIELLDEIFNTNIKSLFDDISSLNSEIGL